MLWRPGDGRNRPVLRVGNATRASFVAAVPIFSRVTAPRAADAVIDEGITSYRHVHCAELVLPITALRTPSRRDPIPSSPFHPCPCRLHLPPPV